MIPQSMCAVRQYNINNMYVVQKLTIKVSKLLCTADHQIMSHLLAHEGQDSLSLANRPAEEEAEYSSSSDDNSEGGFVVDDNEEESSDGEDFTVRVSQ